MNIRQGRTFYYTTLSGVNLIEAAVKDLVYEKAEEKRPDKKFMLRTLSDSCLKDKIKDEFKDIYSERVDTSLNPMENNLEKSLKRKWLVRRSIKSLEKEIYG